MRLFDPARRLRPLWIPLVVVVLLVLLSSRVPRSFSAPPDPDEVTVPLHIRIPEFSLDEGGLHVEGLGETIHPGAPRLPLWSRMVELPAAGEIEIKIERGAARTIALEAPIPAAQVPAIAPGSLGRSSATDEGPSAIPMADRPDPAIYGRDALYPADVVEIGEVQWRRGKRLLPVRVYPFQYNPLRRTLSHHPAIDIEIRVTGATGIPENPAAATLAAIAGTVNPPATLPGSLRIYTAERGMHRITYAELEAAGVPVATANPAHFAISYLGQPVDIEIADGGDGFGPGDSIRFYAEAYHGRYMTENVYWFSIDPAAASRVRRRTITPTGSEPVVDTITQTLTIDRNNYYLSTLERPTNDDHFFDVRLFPRPGRITDTRAYTGLTFDDPTMSGSLRLRPRVHGYLEQAAALDHAFELRLNDRKVGEFQWDGPIDFSAEVAAPATLLQPGSNKVEIVASTTQLPGGGVSQFILWTDSIEIDYLAHAEAENDRIVLDHIPAGRYELRVSGFSSPGAIVYDVRDPRRPVRLRTTQSVNNGGSYSIHAWDDSPTAAAGDEAYAVTTPAAMLAPSAIVADTPSNLHAQGYAYDYIAVVHPLLASAFQPLLDYRAAEGLRTVKIDVQDIFDEFSYGRVDPNAIRAFFTHAYHAQVGGGDVPPAYAVLVGDGHYDFKQHLGLDHEMPNLIPPYMANVDPWLVETAADNRYVTVDGPTDLLPDISLGRISARSPADVSAYHQKVVTYEASTPGGAWQERVVFVADDDADPAGNFHALSDGTRNNFLPPMYDDRTIYYDPDASESGTYTTTVASRAAVADAFNDGALVIRWFGHASPFRWGTNSAYRVDDVATLDANTHWPLTISYSCVAASFHNLDGYARYSYIRQALGEQTTLTPLRGSIAEIGPTGYHIGVALRALDRSITTAIFQDHMERVGPIADRGREEFYASSPYFLDLIDTTVVLGDPALRLRLPDHPRIKKSSIRALDHDPVAGGSLSYELLFINDGHAPADNTTIVVDYDQSRVTVTSAPGATDDGDRLTWTLGSVNRGLHPKSFTVVVNGNVPIGTMIDTVATFSADGLFDAVDAHPVTVADPQVTPTVAPTETPTVTPTVAPPRVTLTPTVTPQGSTLFLPLLMP